MNDAGLTVATLDVYLTKDGAKLFEPAGIPLTFCYRRILEECATVDEAAKLMRSLKATTCMNLAVCDQKEGPSGKGRPPLHEPFQHAGSPRAGPLLALRAAAEAHRGRGYRAL
jgi:hypothetical protein